MGERETEGGGREEGRKGGSEIEEGSGGEREEGRVGGGRRHREGGREGEGREKSLFLFCWDPQWFGQVPPTLGRAICPTESTDSNSSLFCKPPLPPKYTQK